MLLVLLVIVLAWALVTAIAVLPGFAIYVAGTLLENRHERISEILTIAGGTLAIFGWIASWVFLGGSGDEFGIGGFPFNG